MQSTETAIMSVDEATVVDIATGEIIDTKIATAEQLRDFAIDIRESIPRMSHDELDQLDALLVAVAKRLRQLKGDAAQAEASRVVVLRKIGELLGAAKETQGQRNDLLPDSNKFTPTDRKRRHSARLLAEYGDVVDDIIEAELQKDVPRVSVSRLVNICQNIRSSRDVPITDRRFPILYVDPPWRYEGAESANRQIENQYGTMSLEAIKALDVPGADNAVLFFWVTSPKLAEGLEVLRAWNFDYRTSMVWVKDRIGMGYYARQQHELLLIAKRGKFPVPEPENRPSSVFHAKRGEHSAKPELVYELIESMYPEYMTGSEEETCFCEMFQRSPRAGWYGWGLDTKVAA